MKPCRLVKQELQSMLIETCKFKFKITKKYWFGLLGCPGKSWMSARGCLQEQSKSLSFILVPKTPYNGFPHPKTLLKILKEHVKHIRKI